MNTKYKAHRILELTFLILWFLIVKANATDYYVSPSGNDSNMGISSGKAWKTIDKVNSVAFKHGDRILFEGGKKFIGSLKFDAADDGTRANPVTVGSYGKGRATISSGTDHGFYAHNCEGFCVKDIVFVGAGHTVDGDFSGIVFHTDLDTGAKLEYVRIDNVDVSGYRKTGILISADNPSNSGFKDVRITNVAAHNNGEGISSTGYFPADPSNRSHRAIYVGNCRAYNNAGVPGMQQEGGDSGNGIVLSGVDGAVIEYCRAYNNGWLFEISAGPVGIWAWEASNVVIQFCESHHNRTSGGNGDGFDLDGGCVNCVMQYNYSHDNDGPGYSFCQFPGASEFRNNVCRYNISENDGLGGRTPAGAIGFYSPGSSSGIRDTLVYNNTIYISSATRGPGISGWGNTYNTSIHNNIIVTAPGKCVVHVRDTSGGYSFKGNCYWSSSAPIKIMWDDKTYTNLAAWRSATGQERAGNSNVGFEIDPMLVASGKGVTIADTNKLDRVTFCRLRVDSPVIDSGLDLKTTFGIDSGSRDFFNNTVPQGKGQDIGAHEIILEENLPLHVAAASGNINKVKELISARANVNKKDKHNQTPVDLAIRHSHKEVVELLAAKGADFSIHLAAYLANVERLLSLIENDSDVNQKNKDGQTSLHLAARSGHKEVARLLIAKGAIVNEEDQKNSFTPLHYASRFGHIEVAKLLIAEGSRINARDDHGFIPLHWAALCNQKQLVELLLAKGAQVNAKDKVDRTPLYYSCMFREADADIIELLLANGADVNAGSWPSLFVAVHNDNIALAEYLIDHGTNVNAKFSSPSESGIVLQLAPYVSSIEMVELLIAKGADVNAGPWTALHGAVEERRRDIVELLIRKGADVNAKDKEGKTALWYAKEIGHTEIVELLRKHGAKAVQKQQKKK